MPIELLKQAIFGATTRLQPTWAIILSIKQCIIFKSQPVLIGCSELWLN